VASLRAVLPAAQLNQLACSTFPSPVYAPRSAAVRPRGPHQRRAPLLADDGLDHRRFVPDLPLHVRAGQTVDAAAFRRPLRKLGRPARDPRLRLLLSGRARVQRDHADGLARQVIVVVNGPRSASEHRPERRPDPRIRHGGRGDWNGRDPGRAQCAEIGRASDSHRDQLLELLQFPSVRRLVREA
jgi:hypothetical protein